MTPTAATLEKSLQDIDAAIKSATDLLQEKSFDLASKPNDPTLLEHVQRLEAEITGHRTNRGRVEASLHELAKRDSSAGRRKRADLLASQQSEVQSLGRRLRKASKSLIQHVEQLGPMLAEIDALGSERLALVRAMLREGAVPSDKREQYHEAAAGRRVPLSSTLAAALWRAGLGRVAADLDPFMSLTPPRGPGDRYLRHDLLRLLEEDADKTDSVLSYGMHSVVSAANEAARG